MDKVSNYANVKRAIFAMLCSALAFSTMQIFVAKTADTIPVFQQMFFRNLIATFIAYLFIKKDKIQIVTDQKNLKVLVARSLVGYLSVMCNFYASGNANQGDVATLAKMSPFITILGASIFLKEKITKVQIKALILAAAGAVMVSGPKFDSHFLPIFAAFCAAIFSGFAHTFISMLKGKEKPWSIIFFFSGFSTLLSLPLMLQNYKAPTQGEFLMLLMIGIFAAIGQLLMTYSYSLAKASVVSIYNYSGIIFSMFLGFTFLQDSISILSLGGGVLVILGGVTMYLGNKKSELLSTTANAKVI